jgi:hypothetical protein
MLPPSGTPTLTRHPQLLLQLTATPAARAAHTRSTANSSSVHYSSSSSSCRSQQQQPRLVASASQQQYHNTFEGSGSSSSCHLVPQLRPKLLLTRGHYRQQHLLWCSSSSNSSSVNSSQGGSMGKASTALSKRLHAYVSGNVQGVFFRSYTKVGVFCNRGPAAVLAVSHLPHVHQHILCAQPVTQTNH